MCAEIIVLRWRELQRRKCFLKARVSPTQHWWDVYKWVLESSIWPNRSHECSFFCRRTCRKVLLHVREWMRLTATDWCLQNVIVVKILDQEFARNNISCNVYSIPGAVPVARDHRHGCQMSAAKAPHLWGVHPCASSCA